MGYVNTHPDPMEKEMSVSLWSGDRFLNGVRLPFCSANTLAQSWVTGKPRQPRGSKVRVPARYAYVQDGAHTLKYLPTGAVMLIEPAV
jgi:hypothetical protein